MEKTSTGLFDLEANAPALPCHDHAVSPSPAHPSGSRGPKWLQLHSGAKSTGEALNEVLPMLPSLGPGSLRWTGAVAAITSFSRNPFNKLSCRAKRM